MTTTWSTPGSVVVCSRSRAANLLSSTNTRPQIGAFVSICCQSTNDCGPQSHQRPYGLSKLFDVPKLLMRFDDDSSDTPYGPKMEHVELVINFFTPLLSYFRNEEEKKLVVHCYAGIARSTAVTLIGFAMARGAGMEPLAMRDLLAASENGDRIGPNPVLVGLADEALKRDRRLIQASISW